MFTKKLSAETVVLPFPHFLMNSGNRKSGLDVEREVIEKATVFWAGGKEVPAKNLGRDLGV